MTSLAQTKLHKIVVDADLPMDLRAVACEALSSQPITRQLTIMLGELAHDQDCPLTLRRYAIDGLARSDSPIALRMVRGIAQQAEDDLHNYAADTLGAMQRRYTVDSPASENPSRALSGPF